MTYSRACVFAASLALASMASVARAQSPPPSSPSEGEILQPTGVALSAVAASTIAGGIGLNAWGSEHGGGEWCGLDGCFERPNHHARVAGAGLIGGGIGMGLVALPVTIAGYAGEPSHEPRQNEPMMTAGVVATTAGVGFLGGTIGAAIAQDRKPLHQGTAELPSGAPDSSAGIALGALGSVALLGAGIPMWLVGGDSPGSDEPAVNPPAEEPSGPLVTVDNSPTMTYAGIGLTFGGLGLAGIGAAVGFAQASSGEGDFAGFGGLVTGIAIGAPGVLATLTGIPLWIAGEWDIEVPADSEKAQEQRERGASVDVQLGPGSVTVEGRF